MNKQNKAATQAAWEICAWVIIILSVAALGVNAIFE